MHEKYRGVHSQSAIELSTGFLMEELEKSPKELKGLQYHRRNNNVSHPVLPELPGIQLSTKEYTWRYPLLQLRMALLYSKGGEALSPEKAQCPSIRECQDREERLGRLVSR